MVDVDLHKDPTLAQLWAVAKTMRTADMLEGYRATGLNDPLGVLLLGADLSDELYVATFSGIHGAVLGVQYGRESALCGRVGGVWMMTADVVEEYPKSFMRACVTVLSDLTRRFDRLWNMMDAEHAQAIRWGTALGFDFEDPEPYGPFGHPFRRFHITQEGLSCAQFYPRGRQPQSVRSPP